MTAPDRDEHARPEVRHCGHPMAWCGTSVTFDGAPGQGAALSAYSFSCAFCTATATVTVREPS